MWVISLKSAREASSVSELESVFCGVIFALWECESLDEWEDDVERCKTWWGCEREYKSNDRSLFLNALISSASKFEHVVKSV
jgi:hypothetical protein